jgi:malate dehydrogenase (oxaloacetate-decarboxylating)(NADP+)
MNVLISLRIVDNNQLRPPARTFQACSVLDGKKSIPSQAINAYIFPGVGMGIVASGSKLVTNEMFLAAARTLADQVSKGDRAEERIYPPISRIREVSVAIACATAEIAYRRGLARVPKPADLRSHINAQMYNPNYPSYV